MKRLASIVLAIAAGLSGCNLGRQAARGAQVERADPRDAQIQRLKDDLGILESRLDELRGRGQRLEESLRKLEFENAQLRKQLAAVGDAPRERDAYKNQAIELQLEIERLLRQIEELQGPAAQPATAPASAPGTGLAPEP